MVMRCNLMFAAAAMAVMLCSCGGEQKPQKEELPKFEIVKLQPVDRTVEYSFPAILKGVNDVDVYPQVEGRIVSILYENGMLVKKGQPLVKIESTHQEMQVRTMQANVKAAEAVVSSAKLKLDSQKNLYDKKIVSSFVYNTALNEYNSAEAQLSQAKAQLVIAETDLKRCVIVSPITGVVNGKDYRIGSLIGPMMSAPLTTVSEQGTVTASFSIPEQLLMESVEEDGLISTSKGYETKDGKSVNELLEFSLMLKGGKMYPEKGRFRSMSGMVDNTTGTVTIYVDFPNPDGILHSGNSANVVIPYSAKDILVLPQTACKKLQDKYLVYKVDAEGKAVGVVSDVYPTNDGKEYIVVDKSLQAGDEVLANGVANVMEGQKIK